MAKNTKPRSKSQIAKDRRVIARMYLSGSLQVEIAEKLGLDQSTVSRDLKTLNDEWLQSALIDFNEARALELQRINNLEIIYFEAWQRSCEDAETVVKKIKGDGDKELQQTTKGQAGDPRFLSGVQWCIERRCKLLGLDEPERRPNDPQKVINYTADEWIAEQKRRRQEAAETMSKFEDAI